MISGGDAPGDHGLLDPRNIIILVVPSSHYYLGSLSWTSRTFSFPDSRDLREVLGGLNGKAARSVAGIGTLVASLSASVGVEPNSV